MRAPNDSWAPIATCSRRLGVACGHQPALDNHPDEQGNGSSYPRKLEFTATTLRNTGWTATQPSRETALGCPGKRLSGFIHGKPGIRSEYGSGKWKGPQPGRSLCELIFHGRFDSREFRPATAGEKSPPSPPFNKGREGGWRVIFYVITVWQH